jgi:hypothetical protein
MKKYILIQNDGEIEPNSFELIGASTKRGEAGKIGFFGSGLKYSIAYMMRKGIDFKIYSGMQEFHFTTKSEFLKDKSFERICINNTPTSYTTTMGPTWTEDWFVLREIYCNAVDEGSCTLVKETENVLPSDGKTRIFIEQTASLKQAIDNWNGYFSDERTPIISVPEVYTCYIGTSDTEPANTQSVDIYEKTEGVIYRKGIRVYKNDDYLFDYGMKSVDVNEDRTAKNMSAFAYAIRSLMALFPSENYVRAVLRTGDADVSSFEYRALSAHDGKFNDEWISFSDRAMLVVREISAKYIEQITRTTMEVFYIPASFARSLKKMLPAIKILGMGSIVGEYGYNEIDKTAKMDFLLKEVLRALAEMNYHISFEIVPVEFDKDHVMGMADTKNKRILIADTTFDKGRREIALTLMEENEHIISGAEDESRKFQTHIFSGWLKYMEESNGLFL